MPSDLACWAKCSNELRGSCRDSSSSGNCGRRVKHGMESVLRNAAGWAAMGTVTAFRICRMMVSKRSGSCSHVAPTTSAPAPIMERAQSDKSPCCPVRSARRSSECLQKCPVSAPVPTAPTARPAPCHIGHANAASETLPRSHPSLPVLLP